MPDARSKWVVRDRFAGAYNPPRGDQLKFLSSLLSASRDFPLFLLLVFAGKLR